MRNRCRIYLFPFCAAVAVFLLLGNVSAQEVSPLVPPTWSVGDWWIVECQVYNLGNVVARPSTQGWGPRQGWRFHVEGAEPIGDHPYFVLSIHPLQDNKCPYSFRYWFRSSDRYVGRYELVHPNTTSAKERVIGPPIVRKEFSSTGVTPFFPMSFPTLPMTVPLFGTERGQVSFGATHDGVETLQEIEELDTFDVSEKADASFLTRMGRGVLEKNTKLIRIRTTTHITEQQYWNTKLPWCVYGERFDNSFLSKRYWLTEVGKN